jgi:stage II sporulation protein D
MHRRFWGLLVAAIVLSPVASARATVPVVVIDGRGWGHGVGMAQDGAFWMAKAGATTPQILGQFYPGASLGKVSDGTVRVAVFTGSAITVGMPGGGRIDDATGESGSGFPINVEPGGTVRLVWGGGVITVGQATATPTAAPTTTTTASTTTTLPIQPKPSDLLVPPTTSTTTAAARAAAPSSAGNAPATAPPRAPSARQLRIVPTDGATTSLVERNRSYRGVVDVTATDAAMRVINQLDVEHYLRGMGEVRDPNWPPAALRTQAIAARTYALRGMTAAGELCDTSRCQVYLGAQAEYAAMDKAVAATAGQVLMYNHALASAVYSANAGGRSATPEEGFGTTGSSYPYLRSAPYETQNPMPWSVTVGLDDLAAHLGHLRVSSVQVASTGPSGRALTVVIDGPDGRRTVSGRAFAAALGLRSTMFAVRTAEADVAPAPIEGGSVLQAPPDELGAALGGDDALGSPALAASPLALPDRGAPPLAHHHLSHATSFLVGLLQLLAAVAAITAAGWRRRRAG